MSGLTLTEGGQNSFGTKGSAFSRHRQLPFADLFGVSPRPSTAFWAHSIEPSQSQRWNSRSSEHSRAFFTKYPRQHPTRDQPSRPGVACPHQPTMSSRCCLPPPAHQRSLFRAVVIAQHPPRQREHPVGLTGIRKTPGFGPKTKSPSSPPGRTPPIPLTSCLYRRPSPPPTPSGTRHTSPHPFPIRGLV